MKKNLPLYLYGTIIMLVGLFLFFSGYVLLTYSTIRITLGISLLFAAAFAFRTAFVRQRKQVQYAYHEMHALAMLIYALTVIMYCDTFEKLTDLSIFLFFYYAFSEIIFCNWLFNLDKKVSYKILMSRLIVALFVGIGTIIIMQYPSFSITDKLESFGLLFVMVSVNVLLYIPIIKTNPE